MLPCWVERLPRLLTNSVKSSRLATTSHNLTLSWELHLLPNRNISPRMCLPKSDVTVPILNHRTAGSDEKYYDGSLFFDPLPWRPYVHNCKIQVLIGSAIALPSVFRRFLPGEGPDRATMDAGFIDFTAIATLVDAKDGKESGTICIRQVSLVWSCLV
jgi:hypothetical protein